MTHLKVACAPVILDQVVLVQYVGSAVCQVHSPLKQVPIGVQSIQGHTIQLGVTHHANIQVPIAQPGGSISYVLDSAQYNLSIEVVRYGLHELGLDRQLHVEEGQVELQLLMTCTARTCLQQ